MSESAKRIPALDGVRGLAAAAVFILHYGGGNRSPYAVLRLIATAIDFGWAGVSLFFVLSGFLISSILWDGFDREHWWRRFYWRRSLRIFPLYYFALALSLIAAFIATGIGWPATHIWPYLIYLQNVPTLDHVFLAFPDVLKLGHFWSLAVEEQFYLIWPFLLVWRYRDSISARRLCLLVWILSLAFRIFTYHIGVHPEWATASLPSRAGELAMGAWLALAIRDARLKAIILRYAHWIFTASLLAVILVMILAGSADSQTFPMATAGIAINGVLFTSLIALCLREGKTASFFSMGWLRHLGKISYGIYVYHVLFRPQYDWLVTRIFPNLGRNGHFLVLFVVAATGTLIIANLSFYLFEARFLRIKDRMDIKEAPAAAS